LPHLVRYLFLVFVVELLGLFNFIFLFPETLPSDDWPLPGVEMCTAGKIDHHRKEKLEYQDKLKDIFDSNDNQAFFMFFPGKVNSADQNPFYLSCGKWRAFNNHNMATMC